MPTRHPLGLLLALVAHLATRAAADTTWFSFDGLTTSPARFETKLAHDAALIDGPPGHRALAITVPDLSRDERACAFVIPLPPRATPCNAVRIALQGDERTRRVEVVLRTPAGAWAADVAIGPEWRDVTLSARNMTPWPNEHAGTLDPGASSEVRFCIGEWQGQPPGPHRLCIGPLLADQLPAEIRPGPVETLERPQVTLPAQPFTVELLDLQRGQWQFDDALGQRLSLPGPVVGYAPGAQGGEPPRLGYLCCDPEFPQDPAHAVLKRSAPSRVTPEACWYRLEEPSFAATVTVSAPHDGLVRCELRDISLGPAVTGDRYVGGLYLCQGDRADLVWLAPDQARDALNPRLLTDRVGHVFTAGEPVALSLATSRPLAALAITVTDYATGLEVWRGAIAPPPGSGLRQQPIALPLARYGVFVVTATSPGWPTARLRLCRVPAPRAVDPDQSVIGINLFQQQVWWYAWQAPLLARAGVHWLRPWLAWENVWRTQEPQPGQWDTRALDTALRRMALFGQRYQGMLFAAPSWVAGGNSWGVPPPARMDQWSAYVERVVKQYRGRIRYWEVWNEPDGMWPEDTRQAGEHYAAMLRATRAAARRADPESVLLGISHAGDEDWLARLGKLNVAETFDVATVHSYATPADFGPALERRRALLDQGGMGARPMWVNEFGSTAYDFSPTYSAKYNSSERQQAADLPALYAQALAAGPQAKAFWFCSYDPRDAARESQWTSDCGVGLLYLGFLPKLAYAALAATASELDGRACLGRADGRGAARGLHQVAFEGNVSVLWHDGAANPEPVPVTTLGCLPDELLTLRDMYGNQLATGPAREQRWDVSRSTAFVEGSRQLAAIARCERVVDALPRRLALMPGQTTALPLALPASGRPQLSFPAGWPVVGSLAAGALRLTAPPQVPRAAGVLRLAVTCPAGTLGLAEPYELQRAMELSTGAPNLLRDGGFTLGDLAAWSPQFAGEYAWDAAVGHLEAGSLRLVAGHDRRLVQWRISPRTGRSLRFSGWVRTADLAACRATLTVALFAADHWLKSLCVATTDPAGAPAIDWPLLERPARIPSGTTGWSRLEAELPGEALLPETRQIAFHVDVKGGRGTVWFDDLDLWQPEP